MNLLIDGVRFGETYQGYGRDLVDTELLKRVEILKVLVQHSMDLMV
ncbi:MAG: hypothetical protein CM15mP127_03780 [Gammaproteobacteria bacterium]|nr:MAG: hypothetical protein CM15mP127_03780 [Gammaproteobacteria bacterium]